MSQHLAEEVAPVVEALDAEDRLVRRQTPKHLDAHPRVHGLFEERVRAEGYSPSVAPFGFPTSLFWSLSFGFG